MRSMLKLAVSFQPSKTDREHESRLIVDANGASIHDKVTAQNQEW